jgi:hypothetical protein
MCNYTNVQMASYPMVTGVKWPGRETDHSPPSSSEVKDAWGLYLHSLNTPSWCGVQLKKHRDNFTFVSDRRCADKNQLQCQTAA